MDAGRVLVDVAPNCGRDCAIPAQVTYRDRVGYFAEGCDPGWFAALFDDPCAPFREAGAIVIKNGRSSRLVRTGLALGDTPIEIAYKQTRAKGWLRDLKERLRIPRPLRAWRLGQAFVESGLPTARPVLAIVPRHPFAPRVCYIATEWLTGGQKLDVYIRTADRCELPRLADLLGRAIARLHAAGFSHRDLKEENLIVTGKGDATRVQFIDLDGVTRYRRVPTRRRVRDISRLFISAQVLNAFHPTDYRRFLQTYLAESSEGVSYWKTLWRRIARDGERRLRVKAKKKPVISPVTPWEEAA